MTRHAEAVKDESYLWAPVDLAGYVIETTITAPKGDHSNDSTLLTSIVFWVKCCYARISFDCGEISDI